MMKPVVAGEELSIEDVVRVANGAPVSCSPQARVRMEQGRARVEARLADGLAHYGINTGFGALAEVRIDSHDLATLQTNLVRSHASGVGEPLPCDAVRAAMLLRVAVLATGFSGVRPVVAETLIAMLNARIHPRIPSRGSVGASGDLAPLAHMALALIGEGQVEYRGQICDAAYALSDAGIAPVTLAPKEGLALINGTQVLTAVGCLALHEGLHLALAADVTGAMSVEALLGTPAAFDPRIHAARPHPGQVASAAALRTMFEGSQIRESHRSCGKVQDPYSLRCMPQVHGAVRDSLDHVRRVLTVEINAATDNPLVFEDGDILSGGNFHGEPVAIALDLLAIALSELASISERRIEQLVNPALSSGLPPFLAPSSGLCSGLMIAQVAAASLVSENKILAHPASVDSIPTSANREDHVSMGMTAALKARAVVANVRNVLAIEGVAAAAGLDARAPLRPGRRVVAAYEAIRAKVAPLTADRPPAPDIEAVARLLCPEGGLVEAALS